MPNGDVKEPLKAGEIPEPFPGYGKFITATSRDVRAATKRMQEAEQRLVSHEHKKWIYRTSLGKGRTIWDWQQAGSPGTYSEWRGVSGTEAWQRDKESLLVEQREAVRVLGEASWFSDFYNTVPNLVEIGAVTSLEDYLELMKSDPTNIVSPESLERARGMLTRLTGTRKATPREDAPDWLQVTPEEEEAAREFLKLERPIPPPTSVHQLSVQGLLSVITAERPPMEFPEGMTDKEFLAIASVLDIPESELTRAVDMTELITPFANAMSEREERIKAVLAGEEEWKMPEMGFWETTMMTLLSPMQVAADIIRPHLVHVSYPIAGFAAYTVSRFLSGTQDIEDKYDKMKATGYSPWEAMSEAYQDWDLPWLLKLGLEIITDPITYTPGLLLSVPGKIATKVGFRTLGSGVLRLNRGMWSVLDIPFDAFKATWAAVPKTFAQATRVELDAFRDLLVAATAKQTGKVMDMFTPADLSKAMERSVKDFVANPKVEGDAFIDLGRELLKHSPLSINDVKIWSRSLGGKLEDVNLTVLESVNDILTDVLMRVGSPAENAKRMAIALMVEDSPAVIGKIIKDISVMTTKYAARVPRAIEIGTRAKIAPVLQMTEYLVSGQRKIISAIERSDYATGKFLSGTVLSLMNKVDKLERGVFRTTLDRWLVRPFAEAYLGSVAYPIWNVFEGLFVSAMEGVVPRMAKQNAFQRTFLGIRGVDSRVAQWSASDVVGMLGTMPGREGAISLLPGKVPEKILGKKVPEVLRKAPEEVLGLKTPKWIAGTDWFEWTGRKWIELSDVWGTALRANFLMRKMGQYLAEYSYNVAGHDVNAAFRHLIGKPPGIGKKTLGLTEHELKQEMFERCATGLKAEVLGMKELLSNTPLMQGEALKILRQATEISPQAKTLGEQMLVAKGVPKTSDDTVAFCKVLADQSVADLHAFPAAQPGAFRFMADQIEALAARKPLVPTKTGYRIGEIRVTKGGFASEGEGLYVAKTQKGAEVLAPKAGKVSTVPYRSPKNAVVVDAERSTFITSPPTAGDSAWKSANKEAFRRAGRDYDKLNSELTKVLKERGYDAVDAEDWFVLLDESLWKGIPEAVGGISTPDDLMQIFQHYEVMADSASRAPMRLLSQVFEEADELKRLGKFQKLEGLWRNSRVDVENIVTSINESLSRTRVVIQGKSGLLAEKQQLALNALLERQTARVSLQEQFLRFDGRLLDDFWALPKAARTQEEHAALRAYRWENILKYKNEDALLGAGDFLERQSYAKLYHNLPPPKLFHVDASARALSADDCAKVMNCNVDALTTGLMESMTFQDKAYFIQMIKQSADAHPTYFKGFTDIKIGQVYDDIVRGMKMVPGQDIATQKILQQVEGVKQRMIALRMNRSLSPTEEKALHGWIDDVARGMDNIIGEAAPKLPGQMTVAKISKLEVRVPLASIRREEPKALAKLTKEIKAEGITEPIVIRVREDGSQVVWDGVHRLIVAQDLGLKNVPVRYIGEVGKLPGVAGKQVVVRRAPKTVSEQKVFMREELDDFVKKHPDEDLWFHGGGALDKGEFLESGFVTKNIDDALEYAFGTSDGSVHIIRGRRGFNIVEEGVGEISGDVGIAPVRSIRIEKKYAAVTKVAEAPPAKGIVTTAQWDDIRQHASERAHKEYYKAFADYTNENIIDAIGKQIYPFWTYHLYRWFFLPRTFLRKPGAMAAWGKYYEYSDYGYVHIPGTDLEFNPCVGSAFGATFSLARHDFKTYYENLGWFGEVLDWTERRGFYVGVHGMLPIVLSPIFSGRPPELGQILPPLHRVGLNLLVVSGIPGVSQAARRLKDKVFHENFHEYYTASIVSSKQVEAGGKLIDGQAGVDLWFKMLRGEKLTEDEQALWDEAYNEAAWYAILRSEFPEFRLRPDEFLDAHKQVTDLIEAQTGMDAELQDNLWRHNLRPTDVMGGMPLDLQMALDQMWQWRIYFGRGAILMPPEYSDLYNLMGKYRDKVESLQLERLVLQTDTNRGFLQPTAALHYSGREWRREYANNWSAYTTGTEILETDPEFADAIDAMTPEGHMRLMKELGFTVPAPDPTREVISLYFDIELEKKTDPYTGEEDWDYLRFWLEREACRMALTEEQRADFDAYVRRYQTPMEVLFKQVSTDYLKGYRAVTRIVLEEFTEEEKALIAEYYADTTTRTRKLEIKEFISHGGRKLISHWDSRRTDVRAALREASPKLDFWLYVFGYITAPKTDEAKAMVDAWEKDKSSIVRGITETPLLIEAVARAAEKAAKEVK